MNPRFTNPWPHPQHRVMDILRWKLGLGPSERSHLLDAPDLPATRTALAPERIALPPPAGWRAVWLGHASFLLQGCGVSLLIDPMFSDFCAPLPFPSLRRKVPPPCDLTDLPPVDAVLLSHSHYDHLDLPTLRKLGPSTRLWVPEGHAAWLRKKGFSSVEEVSWNESIMLHPHLRITATPAQHFTARSLTDRDLAHWCGWRIDSPQGSLWHAGDSAYCAAFREIGERYGPVDLGMIPIGAYQPRRIMQAMHMNPEEAVRVFLETRCRHAIAMHWGTFRLTDEALGEPPMWLEMALREKNLPPGMFTARCVGSIHEFAGDSAT